MDDAAATVRFAILNELIGGAPPAAYPYLERMADLAADAVKQSHTAWAFEEVARKAKTQLDVPE